MNTMRLISCTLGVGCIVLCMPPLIMYRILNLGNATGIIVGFLLVLYGIFFETINAMLGLVWNYMMGKILLCIVGVGIITGLVMATVISVLIIRAATTRPSGDETLIVLGCQVKGISPSLMLTERLNAAKKYMEEHEDSVCILSGGQGEDEGISEALCMYNYLTDHGIDKDRLIMEDKSTSTRENLKFSMDIINERGLDTNVAIVTNEFHEYRAFKIAEKLGIKPKAVPARTHWWLFMTYFMREWYGVIYEWTGMTK